MENPRLSAESESLLERFMLEGVTYNTLPDTLQLLPTEVHFHKTVSAEDA